MSECKDPRFELYTDPISNKKYCCPLEGSSETKCIPADSAAAVNLETRTFQYLMPEEVAQPTKRNRDMVDTTSEQIRAIARNSSRR